MTSAERTRKWRAKNPERQKQNAKNWRDKNPDKRQAQMQRFMARHPGVRSIEGRRWRNRNLLNYIFQQCKARAKLSNREFTITHDWLAGRLRVCERTGIPFNYSIGGYKGNKNRNPFFPSIDRIDSNKGYTEDNCQVVCMVYNLAKSNWTDDVVLEMAKALVDLQEFLHG